MRGCAASAAISSTRPSPPIMGASSNAPATARSSSFAAWSTRCAAPSKCRTAWSSATPGLPPEKRIEFRVGIHLGDVVEESDGDLMGDGVNIAARLEGICEPGAIVLSEDAYRTGARPRERPLRRSRRPYVQEHRPAGARLCISGSAPTPPRSRRALRLWKGVSPRAFPSSCCPSLTSVAIRSRSILSTASLRT